MAEQKFKLLGMKYEKLFLTYYGKLHLHKIINFLQNNEWFTYALFGFLFILYKSSKNGTFRKRLMRSSKTKLFLKVQV